MFSKEHTYTVSLVNACNSIVFNLWCIMMQIKIGIFKDSTVYSVEAMTLNIIMIPTKVKVKFSKLMPLYRTCFCQNLLYTNNDLLIKFTKISLKDLIYFLLEFSIIKFFMTIY